ncbi:unnamed protein product [Closterium sp. NIES-54]
MTEIAVFCCLVHPPTLLATTPPLPFLCPSSTPSQVANVPLIEVTLTHFAGDLRGVQAKVHNLPNYPKTPL